MKHLLLLTLPVAFILIASLAQCAPQYVPQTARLATERDGPGNVIAKLKAGKEVRIAYFGGSITAQAGYRVKTLKWFQEQYPRAKVSEINAAIGGTGSDLGVYRLKHDVLDKKPDLVFVEFAVNDGGAEPETIWRNMEGIVRQIWKTDPKIDICYVYTMVTGFAGDYEKGLFPRATGADDMLADYYGIPSISVGYRTAELARAGKLWFVPKKDEAGKEIPAPEGVVVWSDDNVHPRDAGHVVYTQAITEALSQWIPTSVAKPHVLKAPFVADNSEKAKLVPLDPSMLTSGWSEVPTDQGIGAQFYGFLPDIWTAGKPGEKISFQFKGTTAKLYALMGPTIAKAIVTVDGKSNTVSQFDWWCDGWRLCTMPIAEGLPDGLHTVTVEISPEQPDRKVVTDRFKDKPGYDPKKYDGTDLYIGNLMLIGDLVYKYGHPTRTARTVALPAPPPKPRNLAPFQAPKAQSAVTIDGVVSPAEWPGSPLQMKEDPNRNPIKGAPATARVCHDADTLYVSIMMPVANVSKLVREEVWGQSDGAEVVFRDASGAKPGPTFSVHGFASGAHDLSPETDAPAPLRGKLNEAVKFKASLGDGQWTGEWAIPLSAVGIKVRPGLKLGFNLGALRTDGNEWIVLAGALGSTAQLDNGALLILQ